MLVAPCRRCRHLVQVGAARCPACGLKSPHPSTAQRLAWIIGLSVFLIILLVLLFGKR
jgi:hypothetical protein